jgi:hypothetical protein
MAKCFVERSDQSRPWNFKERTSPGLEVEHYRDKRLPVDVTSEGLVRPQGLHSLHAGLRWHYRPRYLVKPLKPEPLWSYPLEGQPCSLRRLFAVCLELAWVAPAQDLVHVKRLKLLQCRRPMYF